MAGRSLKAEFFGMEAKFQGKRIQKNALNQM